MRLLGRIALGVASAWPLAYFVALMASAWGEERSQSPDFSLSEAIADPDWLLRAGTFTLAVALIGFYCWHIRQLDVSPQDRRLWTVILVFGHIIALPVYWSRFWWREDTPRRVAGARAPGDEGSSAPGRLARLPGAVRLLLGVPALFPSAGILLTAAYAFSSSGESSAGGADPWSTALAVVIFGNLAVVPAMVALFVWDAVKGRGVAPRDRTTWVAFLLLGNIVATACYWWARIWRPRAA